MKRLTDHVARWKGRSDLLVAHRDNGSVVIDDTRPVALAPQIILKGLEADIYEYCDSRRTPAHVATWLTECRREFDTEDVVAVLQEFRAKRLMIEEHGWHLSLALSR